MTTDAAKIRDAIIERLKALRVGSGPRFKIVQADPQPQLQPENRPGAAVFIASETMLPEGDGNAADLRFVCDAYIAIKISRAVGKVPDLSGAIDADADAIFVALFTDPDFTTLDPDKALFESVERIERKREFPNEAEAYVADLLLVIQFRYRTSIEVRIPDDYKGADVTVRPFANPDAPGIQARWNAPENEG